MREDNTGLLALGEPTEQGQIEDTTEDQNDANNSKNFSFSSAPSDHSGVDETFTAVPDINDLTTSDILFENIRKSKKKNTRISTWTVRQQKQNKKKIEEIQIKKTEMFCRCEENVQPEFKNVLISNKIYFHIYVDFFQANFVTEMCEKHQFMLITRLNFDLSNLKAVPDRFIEFFLNFILFYFKNNMFH